MPIEIIDKLKQKNNGAFKLLDAKDVEMTSGQDVESVILDIMENGVGAKVKGYYIGTTPPEDVELLWIDTNSNSIDESLNSLIIEELKSIITTQNEKILMLENRVTYLETYGGGTIKPANTNYIILEDGSCLLLEDGQKLSIEQTDITITVTNLVTSENGEYLITEDSKRILKEE